MLNKYHFQTQHVPIFFFAIEKKILLMGNDVKLSKPQTITLMECNFAKKNFVIFCFVFADNGLLIFRTYQILFPTFLFYFLLTTSLKKILKDVVNEKFPDF